MKSNLNKNDNNLIILSNNELNLNNLTNSNMPLDILSQ
jgi:hypothetical protein